MPLEYLKTENRNSELLILAVHHVRAVDSEAVFFVICVYTGKEVVG